MMSAVKIVSSGLFTTIQDNGRYGYSKYGVPKSGVMDRTSFFLANAILNNDRNCAVIEWTMIPPVLEFHGDTVICLTGAICVPYVNGNLKKMNTQIKIKKDDILELKKVSKGVIGFVGIKNGFLSELSLNSRSQYSMVTKTEKVRKNDVVPYQISNDFSTTHALLNSSIFDHDMDVIHVYKGPEFDSLSKGQKWDLLNSNFTISNHRNRMAISLSEPLQNELESMLTSPVLPGTIQLTPSGKLMILMRDCQTTGGYPRILQLPERAIDIVAQKRVGEKLSFEFLRF